MISSSEVIPELQNFSIVDYSTLVKLNGQDSFFPLTSALFCFALVGGKLYGLSGMRTSPLFHSRGQFEFLFNPPLLHYDNNWT